MDFDPRYTDISYSPGKGKYILRDTRTGRTKSVKGVTSTISSIFSKERKQHDDLFYNTITEKARVDGIRIHEQVSQWVDKPSVIGKLGFEAQAAASMLVAKFPPSQGWIYSHDVPVSDYRKYASEIDILVTNERTGEVHIVDLKTGSWHAGDYGAQLSFYKRMYQLGHPDQKVAGIWGLRTRAGDRGFVKAHEFGKAELNSIFYKGVRPKRVVDLNRGERAEKQDILTHFGPARRQHGQNISQQVTFFDVETGPRNEILQIGAVKGVFDKSSGRFQVIDKFVRHFTGDPDTYNTQEWATLQDTHGITPESAALRGAKNGRWGQRHRDAFTKFVGNSLLAGHNIEEFDIPAVFGKDGWDNPIMDTLHIARNIRGPGYNNLGTLFQLTTGMSMKQAGFKAHSALGDVLANAKMVEGWMNRKGSPFQEYTSLIVDNPRNRLSTMFKNEYTGAMVRMDREELTPEELLSENIGTGMSIKDMSDMLDEERATMLDRNPAPGFVQAQGGWFSGKDAIEMKAIMESHRHLTGTLGELTSSLNTSVHNYNEQARNNMIRSMINYDDADARTILQNLGHGSAATDKYMETLKTFRRAKHRGDAKRLLMHARARGANIDDLPGIHDLQLLAEGVHSTFTVNPVTGQAIDTPLDGASIVAKGRADLRTILGRKGAVTKAHNLARYADYYGLDAHAEALRAVRNEDEFFTARMAYNEDKNAAKRERSSQMRRADRIQSLAREADYYGMHRHAANFRLAETDDDLFNATMGYREAREKQHADEAFAARRDSVVMEMNMDGHMSNAARVASLADSEEKLARARKMGQDELKKYTLKVDAFHKTLEGIIATPGQIGAGVMNLQERGHGWARGVWQASSGFIPPELQKPGGHMIDSAFDMLKSRTVRKASNAQIASNVLGSAFAGAASLSGLGPIGMTVGGIGGALSQLIPSIFKSKESRMDEVMANLQGRANFWSGIVGFIEAPFKMLARATKDLAKMFTGLSLTIGGLLVGGLNKMSNANEHYASLTGMSHSQYQDTYNMDAWLGMKEGSMTTAAEDAIATMRTFMTTGEGSMKWSSLALSGSLSSYLQTGDVEGVYNMVNDVAARGFNSPGAQRDIMAQFIDAFGKGALSDAIQAMWTHGVSDVRNLGGNARSNMRYVNRTEEWQGKINNTRAEWSAFNRGLDNNWMKVAHNMWEAFGRDVANVILDVTNLFADGDWKGGFDLIKEKVKELWEAFNSPEGLGGLNFGMVKDAGMQILAAIMDGLASGIDYFAPHLINAFGGLMSMLVRLVASVADKIEPLLAHMMTFEINPKLFDGIANLFGEGGNKFEGAAQLRQAFEEGAFRFGGGDVSKGIVNKKGALDPDNFMATVGRTGTYNYWESLEGTVGKASPEGWWEHYKEAGWMHHGGMLTAPDGSIISVNELERHRQIAMGNGGPGERTKEAMEYSKSVFDSYVGSAFAQELLAFNHTYSEEHRDNILEHLGYRHAGKTMNLGKGVLSLEESLNAAVNDALTLGTTFVTEGLRHTANELRLKVEVGDDRTKITMEDHMGKVKEIYADTKTRVTEIWELALEGAAAEGVH